MRLGVFTTLLNRSNNDEVQEVMTWFKGQAAAFYDSGIQKLVPRLSVWTMQGDYVDSYVKAIHSQCRFCKVNKLYMVKTFISSLSAHASYIP
jgi:hypothetical protein